MYGYFVVIAPLLNLVPSQCAESMVPIDRFLDSFLFFAIISIGFYSLADFYVG